MKDTSPQGQRPGTLPSPPHEDVIRATRQWLERAVIGLNLCPFAKSVYIKEQVRYVVSEAKDLPGVLDDLETELLTLADADPADIDTTLLIVPHALPHFTDFNDCRHFADGLLELLRLEGILQIATFHPGYQFEGSGPDDIENYTNRSPYPLLHLLREASVDRATDAFPDAGNIYERNQQTLRDLGHAGWHALMDDPKASE